MIAFLGAAVLLVAGALLFVLPALLSRKGRLTVARSTLNATLYRNQVRELDADLESGVLSRDQHESARRELESRLIQDLDTADPPPALAAKGRGAAIAAALAVPLLAGMVYFIVGTPQALLPQVVKGGSGGHELDETQIMAMVERLAARMKETPDNAEGWSMLARSYNIVGRFEEAAEAYARAVALIPNNAQLFADYADALAMARGRTLQGEPEKLIARALAIDPGNIKARALAGTVAFDKKDYAGAVAHWQHVAKSAPPESEMARGVAASIAEAQALAAGGIGAAPAAAMAAAPAVVSGVVQLAPELASKIAPGDTVFIFARAAQGPKVPLAVLRKAAGDLPTKFTLDDSMAMTPNMKLSSFPRVIVGARISKSGNATPQPGDLQGASAAVPSSASGVTVVINSEVR